jgi:hypothetical protein
MHLSPFLSFILLWRIQGEVIISLKIRSKEASMLLIPLRRHRMPHPVERRLTELPKLSRTAMFDLWKEHFGASPRTQLRRDLMIPILAYRIQERAFGSLKTGTRTRLRQLAEGFANNSKNIVSPKRTLKPGTRLIREWRNEVHLVHVGNKGYEYKGGRYKSLSQIARLITGTRWSGPLFFGINGDRSTVTTKEAQ